MKVRAPRPAEKVAVMIASMVVTRLLLWLHEVGRRVVPDAPEPTSLQPRWDAQFRHQYGADNPEAN